MKAKNISGIDTIIWLDTSDALIQVWIHLAKNIYLDSNENDRKVQSCCKPVNTGIWRKREKDILCINICGPRPY